VVALSDEGRKLVGDYVDSMGLTLRVASGTTSNKAYGVGGIPHSVLIDPSGKVVWRGHPSGLSKGTVKDALKGARALGGFMALKLEQELGGALASAAKAAEAGKLGKALDAAQAVATGSSSTEEDKEQAQALAQALEQHAALLSQQAEDFLRRRDMLPAVQVLEALAAELSGREAGNKAADSLAGIRKDESLSRELAAAEFLDRARAAAAKLGTKKGKSKLEAVVEKYPGTRAAERAKAAIER